jgi:DNA-binding GntR family transcriptional regulator
LHENLKEDLWIRLQERGSGRSGRHQKYLKEHAEILAAIQDRDSDMARKKMYQHITHIQRDLFGRK